MSIELVLIILIVVVLITTVARVAQVGRRSGGRGWLRRGSNESPLMWAVRAVTGRLHDEPGLPEPAPGEINPLDRLAALMGDGGPGEEPHERHDVTTSPAASPVPIPEPYAIPAPYVPQAPYAPPVVARPVPMPLAAAVAREPEPVSLLQQTRAQRPLPAAAMAVQGGATASSSLSDVGTRSAGWMADLVKLSAASDAALERPASRRRRLYRDAAVVLLAASIVVLALVALGPGIFNQGIGGLGATPTPSLVAVVPTLSPSVSAIITPSPSPSPSPTPSPSASPTPSPSPSPSPSPTPTPTPTPSPTPKVTPKPTPTPPPTPTPTPVPKPVANAVLFYTPISCGGTVSVTYDGSASTHATSYSWTFGQGASSTKVSGTHNYAVPVLAPGQIWSKNVKLTVRNASGSSSKTVVFSVQC